MNKISFGNIKGMLSRDEMRQVKGGSGGTCGYRFVHAGIVHIGCGVYKSQAHGAYSYYGGNWCCDSCASSSYCG